MLHRRLLAFATLSTLAVGLIAAPASAAGTTRWVDKDGAAGPAGCAGGAAAATTIGDALTAAGPGDTIIVCPGTYKGTLTISTPGITLRAAQKWKAAVRASDPGGPLIAIAANNVTVQWLKVIAPTLRSCSPASSGIEVQGVANARIIGNQVIADPKGDPYTTPCGLVEGINVDDGSTAAYLAHNIVRDFQLVGILVHNADARVINNSVQYWHTLDLCASPACRTRPANVVQPTGIRVYGSTATVDLTAVTNAPDGEQPQLTLVYGISTDDASTLRIRRNDVRQADFGLYLVRSTGLRVVGNVVVGSTPPIPATAGAVNPALQNLTGVYVFQGSGTLRDNHVLHNTHGIELQDSAGLTVTGNDATGNTSLDCVGSTGTWTDNLGNNDGPSGLCTDAPIQAVPGSPT